MTHAVLGTAIRSRAFHHCSVKGTFDTIEKAYLIHWMFGIEPLPAVVIGLGLTVLAIILVEALHQ